MGGGFGISNSDAENFSQGSGFNTNGGFNAGVGINQGYNVGASQSAGGSQSQGLSQSAGGSTNTGQSTSTGQSTNEGGSTGSGQSTSQGQSASTGMSQDSIYGAQDPYLRSQYEVAKQQGMRNQPLYDQASVDAARHNENIMQGVAPAMVQQLGGGVLAEGGAGADHMQRLNDVADTGLGRSTTGGVTDWGGQSNFGDVNAYTNQMDDSIARQAAQAQDQMMSGLDARAAASGMSGGSRHGTAVAQGMDDINRNMLQQQAQVGLQANEAAQQRRMQSEEAERARRLQSGESYRNRSQAAQEAQMGRQLQGNQLAQQGYNAQDAAQQNIVNQTGNIMDLGMKDFNALNANYGAMNQYQQAIGAPTVLGSSQQQAQSTNNAQSTNQSDAWNRAQSTNDAQSTNQANAWNQAQAMNNANAWNQSAAQNYGQQQALNMNLGLNTGYGENENESSGESSSNSFNAYANTGG